MEALSISAIIAGVGGIVIALDTHIKHSSCWGIQIDTYAPNEVAQSPQPNTPQTNPKFETIV